MNTTDERIESFSLDALCFRPARQEEAPGVVALVNSAYRGDSSRQGWTTEADFLDGQRTDEDEVASIIRAANAMILLAEGEDGPLASTHLEYRGAGVAYLGMLAVRPRLQGKGLGKRLLAEAENKAMTEWKVDRMHMTVIHLRHELIAFYQRQGYRHTGRSHPFPVSEKFGVLKVPELRLETLEKTLSRLGG